MEGVKCKHCEKEPDFIKHCFDNSCYYNFRCGCKETPLRRNYAVAENEWENKFFNTEPENMPIIRTGKGEYLI
jgi:hypothetical protein